MRRLVKDGLLIPDQEQPRICFDIKTPVGEILGEQRED